MSPIRVLIIGAGIAGPTLAYFLSKSPSRQFQVTVLERSPTLRTAGQNIDIRGIGADVVRKMGLEEIIRSSTTEEEGILIVDSNNTTKAAFPADKSGKTQTFTSDIEIVRFRLAEILYEATKDKAEYIFGDYLTALDQDERKVHVSFANGAARDFELVVGADGLGSRTRSMAFGKESEDWVYPLEMYAAFFTIPPADTDGEWSRWYNAPGRRAMMTRPDGEGGTRSFASTITKDERFQDVLDKGTAAQKSLIQTHFADAGWESGRVLKGMEAADDFYYDKIAQMRMPTWSKGRVTMLGDAGYCASPISGMGTTLAFTGAYTLAGELCAKPDDHVEALANYEKVMRPLVARAQKLPPGAPHIVNPETAWGIYIMHGILGFIAWSGLTNWMLSSGGAPPARAIELKEYGF